MKDRGKNGLIRKLQLTPVSPYQDIQKPFRSGASRVPGLLATSQTPKGAFQAT